MRLKCIAGVSEKRTAKNSVQGQNADPRLCYFRESHTTADHSAAELDKAASGQIK